MEERGKRRLGEILLEDGLLTRETLDEALSYQKDNGGLIGQILIQLGYLREEQLIGALGRQLRLPYIPLGSYSVNMDAVQLLGEKFSRDNALAAFDMDDQRLYIAISDPLNQHATEELKNRFKLKLQIFISTPSEILNLCDLAFSPGSSKTHERKAG